MYKFFQVRQTKESLEKVWKDKDRNVMKRWSMSFFINQRVERNNLPSIGVFKVQICTWFNQFLGQLQISILNSKVKSSSWFSKRFCYEINTLLNYINISIPSVRILKVEIWSWINQFLCQIHVIILKCQEQSSSVIMNSFRWKISHCKEYMIDATDCQKE